MFKLSLVYILRNKTQHGLIFISVFLGTIGFIVFGAIMVGFQDYILEQLISVEPHIRILPKEILVNKEYANEIFSFTESIPQWIKEPDGVHRQEHLIGFPVIKNSLADDKRILYIAPELKVNSIFLMQQSSYPVQIVGIRGEDLLAVSDIAKYVKKGNLMDIDIVHNSIAIGIGISEKLGLKLYDYVHVSFGEKGNTRLRIVAIISSGNFVIDESTAYTSLNSLQKATSQIGFMSDVVVKVNEPMKSELIAKSLLLPKKFKVLSWQRANEGILSVFQVQDIVRIATTFIILLIAGFGIYNILYISVINKKKEIAILKAIGFKKNDIVKLFLYQGFFIGSLGATLGLLGGILVCYLVDGMPISAGSVGHYRAPISAIIVSWNPNLYVSGFLLTLMVSLAASFIPAWKGASLSPIAVIRSE